MKDYSKYYIQGSDHYLIPKDEFENLLKEFEVISNDLETEDKMGDYLRCEVYRLSLINKELQKTIDDAMHYIECDMPYLQEIDKEYEDADGNTDFTYKEYNGSDLLSILKGGRNNE